MARLPFFALFAGSALLGFSQAPTPSPLQPGIHVEIPLGPKREMAEPITRQRLEPGSTTVLDLPAARISEAILEQWPYTFGQEPGATALQPGSEPGLLEAQARMNYRSMGTAVGREETMGIVRYTIQIRIEDGRCHVLLKDLVHTGNRAATNGGLDLGPIYNGSRPTERIRGIGINVADRIHSDIRDQARVHTATLLKRFEAKLTQYAP